MRIGTGLRLVHHQRGVTTPAGAITEPADTIAGTGTVAVSGSGSPTQSVDTIAGSGNVSVPGTGALTEPSDTIAGSGIGGGNATGSGSLTDPADVIAGSGTVAVSGSGAMTEPSDTIAGSGPGGGGATGSGSITEARDTIAGTGNVAVSGSGALTEPADTISGAGSGSASSVAAPTLAWSDGPPQGLLITFPNTATSLHLKISTNSDLSSPTYDGNITITSGVLDTFTVSGIISSLPSGTYYAGATDTDGSTTSALSNIAGPYVITATGSGTTGSGAITEAPDTISGAGQGAPGGIAAPTLAWDDGPPQGLLITFPDTATSLHLKISTNSDLSSPAYDGNIAITSGVLDTFAVSGIISGLPGNTYYAGATDTDGSTTSALSNIAGPYLINNAPATGNGTPMGLLLTLTRTPSPAGQPIGLLLTLTRNPSTAGEPIGLLLPLTKAA